jgi:chromate transporter
MAALQRELVQQKGWLTTEEYGLAYSLARITPGTNIIAFCAASALRILGARGVLTAVLVETAPASLIAVLLTLGFESWRSNPVMMAAIGGTIAAVTGLMWASAFGMVRRYLVNLAGAARVALLAGGAFVALTKFQLSPLIVIGSAALIGFVWKDDR